MKRLACLCGVSEGLGPGVHASSVSQTWWLQAQTVHAPAGGKCSMRSRDGGWNSGGWSHRVCGVQAEE